MNHIIHINDCVCSKCKSILQGLENSLILQYERFVKEREDLYFEGYTLRDKSLIYKASKLQFESKCYSVVPIKPKQFRPYQSSDFISYRDLKSLSPEIVKELIPLADNSLISIADIRKQQAKKPSKGSITRQRNRQAIYDRDGNRCLKCGSEDNLTLDHILPVSKGGETDRSNLQTLCFSCNQEKGMKIIDYRQKAGSYTISPPKKLLTFDEIEDICNT